MRCDALQTFKNISSPTGETLGEIVTASSSKHAKPRSRATAKHSFTKEQVFNPVNQKEIDFLGELEKLAKEVFGKIV